MVPSEAAASSSAIEGVASREPSSTITISNVAASPGRVASASSTRGRRFASSLWAGKKYDSSATRSRSPVEPGIVSISATVVTRRNARAGRGRTGGGGRRSRGSSPRFFARPRSGVGDDVRGAGSASRPYDSVREGSDVEPPYHPSTLPQATPHALTRTLTTTRAAVIVVSRRDAVAPTATSGSANGTKSFEKR